MDHILGAGRLSEYRSCFAFTIVVSFSTHSHINKRTRTFSPLSTPRFFSFFSYVDLYFGFVLSCLVLSQSSLGIGRNGDRGFGHQNTN